MFETLMKPYPSELAIFGENWCGPEAYESHTEMLVARYTSEADDDGQTVEIYCTAMPSRFYTIKALPGKNSIGKPIDPWEMGTGSGLAMAQLAANIGKAVSEGMLGMNSSVVAGG